MTIQTLGKCRFRPDSAGRRAGGQAASPAQVRATGGGQAASKVTWEQGTGSVFGNRKARTVEPAWLAPAPARRAGCIRCRAGPAGGPSRALPLRSASTLLRRVPQRPIPGRTGSRATPAVRLGRWVVRPKCGSAAAGNSHGRRQFLPRPARSFLAPSRVVPRRPR